MNKKVIKKYRAEFDHWLDGGKLQAFYLKDSDPVWWTEEMSQANSNNSIMEHAMNLDIGSDEIYLIIDDEYIELRKALVEGKTIQMLHCVTGVWNDSDKAQLFNPKWEYRVKPDEPKFKVGDWVNEKGNLKPRQLTEKYIDAINKVGSWDDFTEWKPQVGEWCWFWDEETKSTPSLGQFGECYPDSCIDNYVDSKGTTWYYAEPFIGYLPTTIKDN